MLFSSIPFLFYFLPAILFLYVICPWRNAVLLCGSLFFYAWGEVEFALVLICSIVGNYFFGLWIDKNLARPLCRWLLGFGIAANLGLLVFFKYIDFLTENYNQVAAPIDWPLIEPLSLHQPLGLSFFTFQAMTYLVDLYRREVPAERNPIVLGLYISMFPQLIAGPIVRFKEIAGELRQRDLTLSSFALGVKWFIVGLGQKVLIADTLAAPADAVFALSSQHLTAALSWLGLIAYTLQIYFDFAGYSNMAIGLGLMFGFHLPKNFDYPYSAQSLTEFWRRWHMTLSHWFRNYLYIPLGGNRRGPKQTYFNLFVVFLLCGLWHGAAWSFIAWGLFHGAFLVIERLGIADILVRLGRPLRHGYTLLIIALGWVLFRSETLTGALQYMTALIGLGSGDGKVFHLGQFLTADVGLALLCGCIGSIPVLPRLKGYLSTIAQRDTADKPSSVGLLYPWISTVGLLLVLFLAALHLAGSTYKPFIYFRF